MTKTSTLEGGLEWTSDTGHCRRGALLSRRSGGLVDADQLTEGCREDAELRCAQNAETVGDRAEPHQPIINGSFVILRGVESVDLVGGVRCVDQCLAKALDRGVEGVLGADNGRRPLRIFRNDGSCFIIPAPCETLRRRNDSTRAKLELNH